MPWLKNIRVKFAKLLVTTESRNSEEPEPNDFYVI